MGVSVEGKGHGGVPQEILNELGMVAPGEQQRRARVLEVVEAYIRGSPASLRSGLNEVRTTLRESSGRPPWVAKTSPWLASCVLLFAGKAAEAQELLDDA